MRSFVLHLDIASVHPVSLFTAEEEITFELEVPLLATNAEL